MTSLPTDPEEMAAYGLQPIASRLPVSEDAATLATSILEGPASVDDVLEAAARHLLAVSDADTVTAVLTSLTPDEPSSWVALGGRARLREWRRTPGSISVLPCTHEPEAAATQPLLSALGRRDRVVALADAAALPADAEVDRTETEQYGVAAMLATILVGEGPAHGSLSAVRGRPGPWSPVAIADLRLLGAALTARFEQVRARRSLADALERGDHARASAQQFFSTVAHELRTPVAALLGTTEVLAAEVTDAVAAERRDGEDSPDGAAAAVDTALLARVIDDASAIRRAGDHLVSVVGELLSVAGGPATAEVTWVDLAPAVQDALHWLRAPAAEAGVHLESQVPPEVQVRTTSTALRQVLANLLGNAVAYAGPDGRAVVDVVWSRGELGTEWARVRIRDDGPGLSAAQAAEVFKPFVRFAHHRPGSGLGLAISRSLVERDGGLMGVASTEGEGSTFWFEVPGRRTPVGDPAPGSTAVRREGGSRAPAPR
ncbi:hypothetical protein GGQ22_06970 [Nocardioides sp. zg-579]|uniref:histidine kinase n=1 Tax=Nocardioides marmotae TaxID=2663857 RepID=A0A6I3J608_9ACTN|nr:HAMP domain-containing sensor histidine kinase [Nocardioides marmotae]MCR6031183.1 hypothetical protein [Gordonia jinghuaiqii]MTB94822.1 hypothetical protein [Nocardioides marmotae]QKE01191.1 HAMP domain-containing histidine kinase [Nocardioides marmotae]